MSLVKMLILGSVLDSTVSLEAIVAAFRTIDDVETARERAGTRPPWGDDGLDPRDAHARDIVLACST